jgi:hypothetical protein
MAISIGTPTKILDNKTAEDGAATALADCTAIDMDAAVSLDLEVLLTYGSSGTVAGILKVFASYDGTNYDSDPVEQFDLPFLANTAKSGTFSVSSRARYLKAQIVNNDSGANKDMTACYIYAHKQTIS